jgi:Transposase IS4
MSRQSQRQRAAPHRLEDEQATMHYLALESTDMRRAATYSLHSDDDSGSDEEAIDIDSSTSSDDSADEKENIPPPSSWSTITHSPILPQFTYPTGPELPRPPPTTEMGFLQLLLTDATLEIIATNTNHYAHVKGMLSSWHTTKEELWLFIAVHLYMGIVPLPSTHMYWAERWKQVPVVTAFSQHRFAELLHSFHIAPPSSPGTRSTVIDKVLPLIIALQQSFPAHYNPERVLVVDEAMIPFKGRDSMKQYMRSKPTRWGFKVWCLSSNYYLLGFDVYKGKQQQPSDNRSHHDTVVDLVRPYAQRNHILYVDNLFSSPTLFDHLERLGLRSCGTLRPDRKDLPPELKSRGKQLRKHESICWQRGHLSVIAWVDKRLVYFLTNHCDPTSTVSSHHTNRDGTTVPMTKPMVVDEYNRHRGGVDTVDQLHGYYAMGRKSKKNWPSLAWWLMDMCVVNAYRLYCLQTHSQISQLHFRINLMEQLAYPSQRRYEQEPPSLGPWVPVGPHYPERVAKSRDCKRCTQGRQRRVRTNFVCNLCNVHLCIDPCFKLYHQGR